MKKLKAVATVAASAALFVTAFSGVASAHVAIPTFLSLGTNLMVCNNHGPADLLLDGPQTHRSWTAAAGECRTFQNLAAGLYQIGEQTEADEPSEPCDAAPASSTAPREHPGYPLCFGTGYYTHHIDVFGPGETKTPAPGFGGIYNNKYRGPVAPVYVRSAPESGHGIPGLSCIGPVVAINSNLPTGADTGKTCDPPSPIPGGGNPNNYGIAGTNPSNSSDTGGNLNPRGGSLNFVVVVLQMHRATGHI
jgi:hypothetical protein